MDEALEAVDLLADSGLEGVVTWLVRLLGLVAVAGVGLWLFTDAGLLVLPAVLIVVGVVLLVAPTVVLAVAVLAGWRATGGNRGKRTTGEKDTTPPTDSTGRREPTSEETSAGAYGRDHWKVRSAAAGSSSTSRCLNCFSISS